MTVIVLAGEELKRAMGINLIIEQAWPSRESD